MNDEGFLFGKRGMEGEDLGSKWIERLHVDLDSKGELGLEGEPLFSKLSSDNAKMDDEEKKSGSRRRRNQIQVRVGVEDDDAPIGSLFKLKRSRNPKKVKSGFDGGKAGKVEARVECLIVRDEDLGGMDDTLASFKKKLKGPKLKGRNSVSNAVKQLDRCSIESIEDVDLLAKSQSEMGEKNPSIGDNESDLPLDEGLEGRPKSRGKRSWHASAPKKMRVDSRSDDKSDRSVVLVVMGQKNPSIDENQSDLPLEEGLEGRLKSRGKRSRHASAPKKIRIDSRSDDKSDRSVVQRFRESSKQKRKKGVLRFEEGSNKFSDENLDNSLSAFVQKSQSSLVRKTRSLSISKQRVGTEVSEDGSKDMQSMIVQRSGLAPALKLGFESKKSDDGLDLVSGRSLLDPAYVLKKTTKNQISDEDTSQASDCLKVSSAVQKLDSVPVITEEIVRSRDEDLSHEQAKDPGVASTLELIDETQRFKDGLKHCSKGWTNDMVYVATEIPSSVSSPKKMEETNHFGNSRSDVLPRMVSKDHPLSTASTCEANPQLRSVLDDTCDVQKTREAAGSSHALDSKINLTARDENHFSASFPILVGEKPMPCFDGDSLNKHSEKTCTMDHFNCLNKLSDESSKELTAHVEKLSSVRCKNQTKGSSRCDELQQPFGKSLKGYLASIVQSHSLQRVEIEEAPGLEAGPDQFSDAYSDDSQLIQHQSSFSRDGANQTPGTFIGEPLLTSVSMQTVQMEETIGSDERLSPSILATNLVMKSGSASADNLPDKSFDSGDVLQNDSVTSIQKYHFTCPQDQPSDDTSKGTCTPSHDSLAVKEEESKGVCSPPITLDQNDICPEDAGTLLDPENKDSKLTAIQRDMRKIKKRRHGDMAYEGDTDWEILMHGQGFLESNRGVDGDQPFRTKEKSDSPSNIAREADIVGAVAVAAGLKARVAGPVERIRFKEVLKRRGGLQEYLECRNMILGLWSKDVNCILPIEECGVTATPSKNEQQRASLIREIYAFLDQNGYINVGIASRKEKDKPCADAYSKLLEEKKPEENYVARIADSEGGVAFILGTVKGSENLTEMRDNALSDDRKLISEVTEGRTSVMLNTGSELNASLESKECEADNDQESGRIDVELTKRMANLSALSTDPSSDILDSGIDPVLAPDLKSNSFAIHSVAKNYMNDDDHIKCGPEIRKKIIVIGAGPAGLTAARHLQRQGFSVTVLEARNRLGGRVYTDRSSLSVPVDLGASIITGVEADVATERRPDPSSLVCAQLGLELTVLNSDCPLYDIETGEKVPTDLDEALEAEYNSLLDDMVVLVAQKGERAMRMSLEDGLEYALKRRRMAQSITDAEETVLHALVNASIDSGKSGFDGKIPNGTTSKEDILSPLERRVMNWHFANLEYGCAALLKAVSLPYWNQDDVYGGFGGAHCMIKGGYSTVVESLGEGVHIHLNHVVTEVSYRTRDAGEAGELRTEVKVSTSNGNEFVGDAVLITVPLGCLKAGTIKFSPSLPEWKHSSIQRLGFGVLNKVVLEFPEVFWDDSVDYFGATAEETKWRGLCFMFWNVKKTVGAPVLIALVVGQAAVDGQNLSSSDHVNHAVTVLRKLFGEALVPNPVASVVTNWGEDPFSRGAYSYVAVGASGEDYDILGRPVENCLFFAGEATCKEHPDTVGGAMMSGLREAVRMIAIMTTGNDYTAEVEVIEAAQRQSDSERNEVRDILKRLDAVELSNVLYKSSLDGDELFTKEALLQDIFANAKTTAGRLHLAKELLKLPVEALKSFAGTREGLNILNSWILDSMGKDGTQLLRHCVRLLVLVSTDLLAVRLSGIGKTVKEKVCVHTSRDIRAVASQLVGMWIEVFRKEKAANGGLKLLRQATASDSLKTKSSSGKPPVRTTHGAADHKGTVHSFSPSGSHPPSNANIKKANCKTVKLETMTHLKSETNLSLSPGFVHSMNSKLDEVSNFAMSEEEAAAIAAAEAARAAARAAAEAYASSEAECSTLRELPKIPSFHKFARREQYAQMDDSDLRRKKWSGGVLGRQGCISEIDSRNCRVQNWSVDFSATCVNLENSRLSGDNYTQRSYSNEVAGQLNLGEYSGESGAVDSRLTKAWVDSAGSGGVKDYHAIERWQSQAAAADSEFFHSIVPVRDEEDSITGSKTWKHDVHTQESLASQAEENKELLENQLRGAERIKQAVVDYVASLLMPLYKTRKIDKEGYKSIMKKSATKVMEQTTDAEKSMDASDFLDFKRKNKIRAFVDKLIERHMAMKSVVKP